MARGCGIEVVLPANDWEAAFAAVGAVAEQTCLGERLCDALGWKLCPQVPEGLPSVQSASLVFPKKMKINIEAYLCWDSVPASQIGLLDYVRSRRRPLPASFIGTMDHPLTLD